MRLKMMKKKSILSLLFILTMMLVSCTSSRSSSEVDFMGTKNVTDKHQEITPQTKYLQSDLMKSGYRIRNSEQGKNTQMALSFPPYEQNEMAEHSDIILIATVTEVESYAKDVHIMSTIYLNVEKVIQNSTGSEIGDTFEFTSLQGMVPLNEVQAALPEYISQNFDESKYTEEQMNELVVMNESVGVLYEIGMKGLFLLKYNENTGDYRETDYDKSFYLEINEDEFLNPMHYRRYFGTNLPYEYNNYNEEENSVDSIETQDTDLEDYLITRSRLEELMEIDLH